MIEWISSNWITLTAITGGIYLLVYIVEKFVSKQRNKKTSTEEVMSDDNGNATQS